jgi:hypothetical protein
MCPRYTPEEIKAFTPPWKAPQMTDLADACNTGACNVRALLKHLGLRISELTFGEERSHPALPVILGQVSYLCNQATGPSFDALENYELWKNQTPPPHEPREPKLTA